MSPPAGVTREFLDADQYSDASIAAYETVFGRDFLSPGGRETAVALIARLGLERGCQVLDVGCGLGGSAFVMAGEFGLRVEGVDLSRNVIARARLRLEAHGLAESIAFTQADCLALDRPAIFDAVYSRDVFLHIHDKATLFAVLARCLRPGGVLLFTDYCCGARPWSEQFSAYVEQRAYHLLTLDEYTAALETAGFAGILAEDRTQQFVSILCRERAAMASTELPAEKFEAMAASWDEKIARAQRGEQRWGLFRAIKP